MSTDFRALCAELLDALENAIGVIYGEDGTKHISTADAGFDVIAKADAALAQPEPEGPTDEALANFSNWFCRNYPGPDTIIHKPEWHAPKVFRAAAYAIARWGTPAIEPVPQQEVGRG
jgi:hypothetical protein